MLLSEIRDQILMESGQLYFLLDDTADSLQCLGFTMGQFWRTLGLRILRIYEKYRPLTYQFNRTASATGSLGQSYVLFGTDSNGNFGEADNNQVWSTANVGEFNLDPGYVPQWISKVQPTITLSSAGIFYLLQMSSFVNSGEFSRLHEPRTYLHKYERDENKGVLYVTEIGRLEVVAHYQFPYEEITDSVGNITDVDILHMTLFKDDLYIELLKGMFTQAIGRSRRSFLLEGNPVQIDADAMVNEGKEIYAAAMQTLQERSLWWTAIGQ